MAPACINYNIHTAKKLNGEDLIKVIEGFRSVIINTNFLFHPSLHLFIGIYYNKSKPFNYFNYLLKINLNHSI
jgi:hypothetical protein